jgi:hypothetical protein
VTRGYRAVLARAASKLESAPAPEQAAPGVRVPPF